MRPELPNTDSLRQRILTKLKAYFTANPARENEELNVTATETGNKLTVLTGAMTATRNCRTDQRTNREGRDTAEQTLDKQLRRLWKELEVVLEPTDPRWLKFIDRIPGDPRVPEKVVGLVATVQPGGIIGLDWDDSTRAARYKVLKQVVGTDPDFVVVDTVEPSEAQLTGVPTGAMVKLQVVPINGVGEGAANEVIQLQAA